MMGGGGGGGEREEQEEGRQPARVESFNGQILDNATQIL